MTFAILLIVLIGLLYLGMPMFAALFLLPLGVLYWTEGAVPALGEMVIGKLDGYLLVAIPLFMLMAHIMVRGRVVDDLYNAAFAMLRGVRGGVGIATIQVAKALGATVVASVGSAEKAALAKQHGADHVVRTDVPNIRDAFREQVIAAVGKRGVDIIVDPVGGDVFDAGMRVIAWSGRIIVVGFAEGRIPEVKAGHLLVKNISLIGLQYSSYRDRQPEKVQRVQRELFEWYVQGKIRPHVMGAWPLPQYREALDTVRERKVVGKVVIRMR